MEKGLLRGREGNITPSSWNYISNEILILMLHMQTKW